MSDHKKLECHYLDDLRTTFNNLVTIRRELTSHPIILDLNIKKTSYSFEELMISKLFIFVSGWEVIQYDFQSYEKMIPILKICLSKENTSITSANAAEYIVLLYLLGEPVDNIKNHIAKWVSFGPVTYDSFDSDDWNWTWTGCATLADTARVMRQRLSQYINTAKQISSDVGEYKLNPFVE